MVLTTDDFKNEEFHDIVVAQSPYYETIAQGQYTAWLRQYELIDHPDVPADADVDVMVKLALVQWVYMQISSDNINPSALQTFDGDSSLENPMSVSYDKAEQQFRKLVENVNPDSLLQRNRRSSGNVGRRDRA